MTPYQVELRALLKTGTHTYLGADLSGNQTIWTLETWRDGVQQWVHDVAWTIQNKRDRNYFSAPLNPDSLPRVPGINAEHGQHRTILAERLRRLAKIVGVDTPETPALSDKKLALFLNWFPLDELPQTASDGPVLVYRLHPQEHPDFSEQYYPGGGFARWGIQPRTLGMHAYRCVVTNYSDTPIFDVGLTFDLVFKKVVVPIDSPTALTSGEVASRWKNTLWIKRVIEPNESVEFWTLNDRREWATLVACPEAEARLPGEKVTRPVTLDRSRIGLGLMMFGPNLPTPPSPVTQAP